MQKVKLYFLQLCRILKKVYFFKSEVSLYDFFKILWEKIVTFDIDQRAAAVSFSLILAIFPGILFLFTLIPYFPIENLDVIILTFLESILPAGLYKAVASTIEEIVNKKRSDILSIGFLFTIYAATNGMMALMRAFNMTLETDEKRSFFKARWIAFLLTINLIFVLLIAVLILIVGKLIISYLVDFQLINPDNTLFWIHLLQNISTFLILFVGIAVIYYFATNASPKPKFFNIGAFLAAILCIFATNGFSYYLSNFSSYNKLYGSIGTLIGLMIWIYLVCLILILGFEINFSYRAAALSKKKS